MTNRIHIGWGDSMCGAYDMNTSSDKGSSTLFAGEATCPECIRLHNLEMEEKRKNSPEKKVKELTVQLEKLQLKCSTLQTDKLNAQAQATKLRDIIHRASNYLQATHREHVFPEDIDHLSAVLAEAEDKQL